MSDFYVMNQTIIAENDLAWEYRWVVSDFCLNGSYPGITIEYQEKNQDGFFETKSSIEMGNEPAKLLIKALGEMNVND